MKSYYRFTILGCASSQSVPRITGDWGNCDPSEPKNRRTRSSLKVSLISEFGGYTNIIIDTGPDFYYQMLRENVSSIDAVLYTHEHADHIHGIDDLRGYFLKYNKPINIYAAKGCMNRLYQCFSYCFKKPEGSSYPPIAESFIIDMDKDFFCIDGEGGIIKVIPILQHHGKIYSLGFRFGNVAYCTDVSYFPDESLEKLKDLDVLVIGALKNDAHSSHFSLSEALKKIELIKPKRAILTHMHIDLDYKSVLESTPEYIVPAFDGMQFESHLL
ncbi:MBL fold metallo-hydrolase [Candidatus Liberibacter americanus]|uniref:PhnP protein n=1 Tax=Candidatus Liberibacter americanus str. Sao Paulo TaxID=1261131 RepID=U6B578_9HYPH|nr:MBL fold metallo-hydrolase [Candidatus Liberibacter americanus]AHA28065.1 PhnP protein [Candidatus Liberibacter americanus str. Sao Paulo]EMS35965.1 metal-dependent hydrolase protein [Candidatus Liberibacter americanus PW_SP]